MRLNRIDPKKPSAFNKFEPIKTGNKLQNIPTKLGEALRNRQAMKILGLKEEKEHKLLKAIIAREMQKSHRPVPKKRKSPVPMKGRQVQIIKPDEKLFIQKSPLVNVSVPFIISSIMSHINTNSIFRKRQSRVPKGRAKYLGSHSAAKQSAYDISKRYSRLRHTHPRVRQQKRPTASA